MRPVRRPIRQGVRRGQVHSSTRAALQAAGSTISLQPPHAQPSRRYSDGACGAAPHLKQPLASAVSRAAFAMPSLARRNTAISATFCWARQGWPQVKVGGS